MDLETVKLLREQIDAAVEMVNLNGDQITKIYTMLAVISTRLEQLEAKQKTGAKYFHPGTHYAS